MPQLLEKQALLDTINANKSNVESAYGTSAKEAYTNKMLGGKTLSDQLQRLGLSNTGYGVNNYKMFMVKT